MPAGGQSVPAIERIMRRIEVDPETGCWIWPGAKLKGYGRISMPMVNGRRRQAYTHRITLEHRDGPIPHGYEPHHRCERTDCCNPDHLRLVPHTVNVLMGNSPPAQNLRKTHCIRGHILDASNTYITSQGYRQCRTCNRDRARRYYRDRQG